jgi:hypothetical protein
MKKSLALLLVLVIMISLVSPAFAQENDSVYIIPYLITPDENGERIVTVSPDQEILLGARWGACTIGLTIAFAKTATIDYAVDGQAIFASLDDSRNYWRLPPVQVPWQGGSPCMNNSDPGWRVYWEYSIGALDPGDHPAHFGYWNDHLQIDGGDYDGDGKPDHGWDAAYIDFIIRVVE